MGFWPHDLPPRPAEDATQAATDTVGSRNATVKPGRPKAIVFSLLASANNPGSLFGSFNWIVFKLFHLAAWKVACRFHPPKSFSAVLLPIELHD